MCACVFVIALNKLFLHRQRFICPYSHWAYGKKTVAGHIVQRIPHLPVIYLLQKIMVKFVK